MRTGATISLIVAFVLVADYLMRYTPQAAQARCDRENAAVVAAAARIYEAGRWSYPAYDLDVASPSPELESCDCDLLASADDCHVLLNHNP